MAIGFRKNKLSASSLTINGVCVDSFKLFILTGHGRVLRPWLVRMKFPGIILSNVMGQLHLHFLRHAAWSDHSDKDNYIYNDTHTMPIAVPI